MRPGGSKQKGSAFEREVCKQLSRWVSHGKREDLFWRSAMSGGRATVAGRRGTTLASQAGDISSVDKAGHVLTNEFYFETKHVKDIALDKFIVTGSGPLANYWKIAYREARAYNKEAVIIIRQNRFPTLLLAHDRIVETLHDTRHSVRGKLAVIYGSSGKLGLWKFDAVTAVPFRYSTEA